MKKDFISSINNAVPVEDEAKILMDGEHDGIQELDNNLPTWWTYFFAGCVIFGVGYVLYYHTFAMGDLQTEEYRKEMIIANAQREEMLATKYAKITKTTVVALSDEAALKNGKQTYDTKCASCHGKAGEGTIGPNLTDDNWLHGCDIKAVFTTINDGVPEKGMLSWANSLNPLQIQEVASYILTMNGSNPANPKEAQGTVCN